MHENISFIIEFLGLISFSMSGAFAAMEKKLDPFGVIIIAFVTSFGGGTIRDVLLDIPVFWMRDMFSCSVVLGGSIFAIMVKSFEKKFKSPLFIFDSFGLGLFTIMGIQKGLNTEQSTVICLTLGVITGCFGGIFRDVLLNRIPLVLRKEIYATACILGGILFLGLTKYSSLSYVVIHISTILLIVAIRTFAVKYEWQMPKFYTLEEEEKQKK
ncbi:MAG: trimeric intracellular cation channel family protein [Flavobacteriaceae bacterium]|nr:trimeric intracellular cation channel family protein [Flavobacteriaceae bacterium]